MELVIKARGLVAYPKPQREQNKLYQELTKPVKWTELSQLFEQTVFGVFGLQEHSLVTHHLQTGISVLKNALCEDLNEDELFMQDDGDGDGDIKEGNRL
jgi:hypothetical protein